MLGSGPRSVPVISTEVTLGGSREACARPEVWQLIWPIQLVTSVTSGLAVASIVAGTRYYWKRTQVPTVMSRPVGRNHYLRAILQASTGPDIESVQVVAPRLTRAAEYGYVPQIQDAWGVIARTAAAQLITCPYESCIEGAVELAARGVEVRINHSLDARNVTYHIFQSKSDSVTIMNDRSGGRDRPVRLSGPASSRIFRSHFEDLWHLSKPLEAILSERIITLCGPGADNEQARRVMYEQQARFEMDDQLLNNVRTHLAFRHGSPVVFIVGLPGSGKSFVRSRLAQRLRALRIEVAEVTDYVYAYRDFVHGSIHLNKDRGSGFEAEEGGAFKVASEENLQPALRELAMKVWQGINESEVSLVEFARADILAALREFGDDIVQRAQIVYVQAPQTLRESRIRRRANPPVLQVSGLSVSLTVSDNHKLPSTVGKSLYGIDDLDALRKSKVWEGRLSYVENDRDDPDYHRIDAQLHYFMDQVLRPYFNSMA